MSPQAPIADLFLGDDSYHNGAFMLAANFSFYTGFFPRARRPVGDRRAAARSTTARPDGYAFYPRARRRCAKRSARRFPQGNTYWDDNLAHPTYDAFWKARAIAPHLRDVTPAVLTVGGWYDAEDLAGPLRIYRAIERQSPARVEPARDGPVGARRLVARRRRPARRAGLRREDRRRVYRERFERPFFEHHLRDAPLADAPEAAVFVTGANAWRTPPAWPPAEATPRTFYLARRRRARGRAGRRRSRSDGSGAATSTSAIPTGRCRTCRTRAPACAATT